MGGIATDGRPDPGGGRALARSVTGLLGLLLASVLLIPSQAGATNRISIQPGFNNPVDAISEPDANGTRYLGGEFTAVDAWRTGAGAATSAAAGAVDRSFPSITGDRRGEPRVFSSAPDGNGGFYVGGVFDCIGPNPSGRCDGPNDVTRNNVAHIRADGTLSPWNPSVTSGNDRLAVWTITVSGNTVYLGGLFTEVGGQPRANAAAVTAGGSGALLAWNPGTNDQVLSLAVSGDTVYLGGEFTSVTGQPRNHAAAVGTDGTLRNWNPSVTGGSFRTGVYSLDVSGGTVYLGGEFTFVGGQPRLNAAAVGTDGTLRDWNPDPASWVLAVAVSGDTVYLGGTFSEVGGQPRKYAAAVSAAGTGTLRAWDPDPGDLVWSLDVSGDTVYLGGFFRSVRGQPRNHAAAVSAAGTGTLRAWDPNPNGFVRTVTVSGERVFIGGQLSLVGGKRRNYAAAVRADGTIGNWNPSPDGTVSTIELAGNTVYLGGFFERVGGQPRNRAAAIGTDGTLRSWNLDLDGGVISIEISGGTVYLGGFFRSVQGQLRDYAAAVGTDGAIRPWNPGPNRVPEVIHASGDTVYLGGYFTEIGGQPRNYAAAVGTDGALRDWNPSPDDLVQAIETSGETVYLGGFFSEVGGQPRSGAAAVGAGGALLPWNPEPDTTGFLGSFVHTLAVTGDTVYLGGSFNSVAGQPRNNAAAVQAGGTGAIRPWSPDPDGPVLALKAGRDTIYLGGYFERLTGRPRPFSAAVGTDGTLLAPWPSSGPPPVPALGKPAVKGPAKAKRGRKTTFKVTVKNTGRATATQVKVSARGKGVKGSKSLGQIAAGKSKTISLPLKFRTLGKVPVTFRASAANTGPKTARKTVKVVR